MPETSPESPNNFERTFEMASRMALDPHRRFVSAPVTIVDPDTQILPCLVILEQEREASDPKQSWKAPSVSVYRRWETAIPDSSQEFESWRQFPPDDFQLWKDSDPIEGASPYARVWPAETWLPYVKSPREAAYILRYVFDQTAQGGFGRTAITEQFNVIQGAILQNLRFHDHPDFSLITDALREVLDTQEGKARAELQDRIYPHLGRALLKGKIAIVRTRNAVTDLPGEALTEAVRRYDEAGLISDAFWAKFGIRAVAGLTTPEFLPLLIAKLNSDSRRIMERHLPEPNLDGRAYMTTIFCKYANDSERHRANTLRILKATLPTNKKDGLNMDIEAIIAAANRMAVSFNKNVDRYGGREEEKFAILRDEWAFVSDAFLRLLSLTRRTDLSPQAQATQWEQDLNHAEVVAILFGQTEPKDRTFSDADVALRFPNVTPRRRAGIRRLLNDRAHKLAKLLEEPQESEPPATQTAEDESS